MSRQRIGLAGAIAASLQIIDNNLVAFATRYPDDATVHNHYPPHRSWGDAFPVGGNFGWTAGFWPGMIWLAYELTGDESYRRAGERHVASFAGRMARVCDIDHHDLGFLYTLSCVAPWRIVRHDLARQTALRAAEALMTRFWDKPGVFQAWGRMDDPQERGRTIVDSLMNMPLLYWASEISGQERYAVAARRHARQMAAHALRPDDTTYHTYRFDPDTGAPLAGQTAQGHADSSCWARGQAWAIYGFALNYAYTRDGGLLHAACRAADRYLALLPADGVPYWDMVFDDHSGEERDSSAAAIAACGLLELVRVRLPAGAAVRYRAAAHRMIASLVKDYAGHLPHATCLLMHGVQSKPHGAGVDEGNLWGDYFYLEALTRLTLPGWQRYW